jgi:hypothetical protein
VRFHDLDEADTDSLCPAARLKQDGIQVAPANIRFLYTNIGRGHPFYLDGILEVMADRAPTGLEATVEDVFSASQGLSRAAWGLVRQLYLRGSSPGPTAAIYRWLRSDTDYNRSSLKLHTLGRSLRRRLAHDSLPLVVAHPSLVAMLRGKRNLLYQHGELVTPREAVVRGASTVFVPTTAAAQPFYEGGYSEDNVVVTGLCIEPALLAQAVDAFMMRRLREATGAPLTGAFFSSGAEPPEHVRRLVAAAVSVIESGGRAVIFAAANGRVQHRALQALRARGLSHSCVDIRRPILEEERSALVALYRSRAEETELTGHLFRRFDYFVAPPHERSNWAVGLGLPMFCLDPAIGPFAPLNRELLVRCGVATSISSINDARGLGRTLAQMKPYGDLAAMADAGWGRHDATGFGAIVTWLVNRFGTG